MSVYTDWIRWSLSVRDRPGFGQTAGDTMYMGLGDYVSLTPMPNGLPIDTREPGECAGWREMVARARRDIAAHAAWIMQKEHLLWLAENDVQVEETIVPAVVAKLWLVDLFSETIREFAESQKRFESLMKGTK